MTTAQTVENEVSYPLPQHPAIKVFGRFFSYLFHPLFIPSYIAAYLLFVHPYSFALLDQKQKLFRLLFVFCSTAFFPAFTVFLLWRLQFADSIFLRTQKERIIPYVASITFFFWAYYVSRSLEESPKLMSAFFMGIFLAASAALLANNYFKISMHTLAVGGAITYMILLGIFSGETMGVPIAISTLITGIVCTSRLAVSDHHPAEIYWGLILGVLSQLIAFVFVI